VAQDGVSGGDVEEELRQAEAEQICLAVEFLFFRGARA